MERERLRLSVAIVAGVASAQCSVTQLSKSVQTDYEHVVDSPLFMTWSNMLLNVVLSLPAFRRRLLQPAEADLRARSARSGDGSWHQASPTRGDEGFEFGASGAARGPSPSSSSCGDREEGGLGGPSGPLGLTPQGFGLFARLSVLYALWLAANYSYHRALRVMAPSLVTSVYASVPALVAVGSLLLGVRLPARTCLPVVLTVVGSVVVAEPWRDGAASAPTLDVLGAMAGALAAAAYRVVFKTFFGEPTPEVIGLILAGLGVFNATLGSLVLLLALGMGAEAVCWSRLPWGPLFAGNSLSLAFNFLTAWGISVTTPLFMSLAAVVNVPLNLAVDLLVRGLWPNLAQSFGIAGILAGFLLLRASDVAQWRQLQETCGDVPRGPRELPMREIHTRESPRSELAACR